MNITELTNQNLIILNATYTNRENALKSLIEKLYSEKKISSIDGFFKDVMKREKIGPTGLGMGLAIPHGKSDYVKEAAFAIATVKKPIEDWDSVDNEDSNVNLVILLAIPNNEAGSTHIDLLTKLSIRLSDEEVVKALLDATIKEEFIDILSGKELNEENGGNEMDNKKTIVCVTACPSGIAHTYMAAEALEKAGKKLGVSVIVERQGANGIDKRLTDKQLSEATGAIFAVEVAVKEVERFDGIPTIEVPVAEPLKNAEKLIKQALELGENSKNIHKKIGSNKSVGKKLSAGEEAKRAMLTGISHIVPVIVAGGTVLAVAVLISQIFGLQELYNTDNSWLWMYRKLGGGMLGTLMVPILSAYMAFSLAEKPGLGPGFAAGLAANMIGGGFLGGIVGGFIAGYLMKWVKTNIKGPKNLNGFMTFYLYPVIGTLVAGSLMLFVIGKPVAALNTGLTNWLNGLSGANAILLGAVLGAMCSFDLGGPVNKASYAFCLGAMANGNFAPYAAFASIKMVSAFTATISTMMFPKYYIEEEIEAGKSTWILGLAGITEGAIPMAIEDPFRVIPAFVTGSAVTGAICMAAGLGLKVPGAGIISLLVMEPNASFSRFQTAGIWLGAALIGTVISTVILTILKSHKHKKNQIKTI